PAGMGVQACVAAPPDAPAAVLFQFASCAVTAGKDGVEVPAGAPQGLVSPGPFVAEEWVLVGAGAGGAGLPPAGGRVGGARPPGPELPAAIATTTPAFTARLLATTSWSLNPLMPPPRLMLMTSIPSFTASSIAWAMSWEVALVMSPGNTL